MIQKVDIRPRVPEGSHYGWIGNMLYSSNRETHVVEGSYFSGSYFIDYCPSEPEKFKVTEKETFDGQFDESDYIKSFSTLEEAMCFVNLLS